MTSSLCLLRQAFWDGAHDVTSWAKQPLSFMYDNDLPFKIFDKAPIVGWEPVGDPIYNNDADADADANANANANAVESPLPVANPITSASSETSDTTEDTEARDAIETIDTAQAARQTDSTSTPDNPIDRHSDPIDDVQEENNSPIRGSQPADTANQVQTTRLDEQAATEEGGTQTTTTTTTTSTDDGLSDPTRIQANRHGDGPGERDVDVPDDETLSPASLVIRNPNPTAAPSRMPSVSPSRSPTTSRAPSRSPSLSFAPSVDCTFDSEGNFGDTDGNNLTTLLVNYTYEIELPNTSSIDDAISAIEQNISDLLVPEFFSTTCATARRYLKQNRRLDVVGMSSGPTDAVITGGKFTYFFYWIIIISTKKRTSSLFFLLFSFQNLH